MGRRLQLGIVVSLLVHAGALLLLACGEVGQPGRSLAAQQSGLPDEQSLPERFRWQDVDTAAEEKPIYGQPVETEVAENPAPVVVENPQPAGQPPAAGKEPGEPEPADGPPLVVQGLARAELTAPQRAEAAAGDQLSRQLRQHPLLGEAISLPEIKAGGGEDAATPHAQVAGPQRQQTAVATPARRPVAEPAAKPPRAAVQLVLQASPSSPGHDAPAPEGETSPSTRRRRIAALHEPQTLLRPARRSIRRRKANRRRRADQSARRWWPEAASVRRAWAARRRRGFRSSAPQHLPAGLPGRFSGPPRLEGPAIAGPMGQASDIAVGPRRVPGGTGDGWPSGAAVGDGRLEKADSPGLLGGLTRRGGPGGAGRPGPRPRRGAPAGTWRSTPAWANRSGRAAACRGPARLAPGTGGGAGGGGGRRFPAATGRAGPPRPRAGRDRRHSRAAVSPRRRRRRTGQAQQRPGNRRHRERADRGLSAPGRRQPPQGTAGRRRRRHGTGRGTRTGFLRPAAISRRPLEPARTAAGPRRRTTRPWARCNRIRRPRAWCS